MPRLAFDVDDNFHQEFAKLVETSGATSKADAFRKAVRLYGKVIETQQNGEKLMIVDSDREPITEIFIL